MSSERPVIEATHRLCAECNEVRPCAEFARDDDLTCTHCHSRLTTQEANRRLEEVQAVLANTTLRFMATERKGTHIDAPHISEAVALGVRKLGGLEGLMTLYTDAVKASYEQDRASRKTLDHLWKFLQLITASTEHRQTAPDVEGLSEEEILAEYQTLALQAATSNVEQFQAMLAVVREKAPELLEHSGGRG